MSEAMLAKCPHCESEEFHYDEFEDMYRCVKCNHFWYPIEIGREDNKEAGIWKL